MTGWFVLEPFRHPYVRIPGNAVLFDLDCVPQQLSFEVRRQQVQVSAAYLLLQGLGAPDKRVQGKYKVQGSDQAHVQIDADDQTVRSAMSAFRGQLKLQYVVRFQRLPFIDLQRVQVTSQKGSGQGLCPERSFEGTQLLERLPYQNVRLMRFDLIQEHLSDLILRLNETLGNLLIAAMVISAIWLFGILAKGLRLVYFTPDTALKQAVEKRTKEVDRALAARGPADVIVADYRLLYGRLAFARATGPALGFALTVASLVAALHPAVQAEQDAFRFVSSLQIAMVATLIGLVIRIVAEFAIRLHRSSAYHQIALFQTSSNTQDDSVQTS